MKRRKKLFIIILIFFVLLAVGAGAYVWKKTYVSTCTDDCNLLLISVDSMRADHMGAYGYKRNTTPNFDKLTQQGTLFNNYFSPSYLTPVSESAVQTGYYPSSTGVKSFFSAVPSDRKIISEYMKGLGYHTQAIVSSPEFTTYGVFKKGFNKGYDSFKVPAAKNEFGTGPAGRQYPAKNMLKNALSADAKSGKKNYMWLAIGGVHWPFGENQPNQFGVTYYDGIFEKRPLDLDIFMNIYDGKYYVKNLPLQKEDYQHITDKYDNGVYAFDKYLGEVMSTLKQLRIDKKTIIIVESEHAESLGEHKYFSHYDITDVETHVPLLIVDPRSKGVKSTNTLAGSVDVLPTILELVGTSTQGLQGKSLVPVIKGAEKDNSREAIFLERVPLWEEGVLQNRLAQGLDPLKANMPLHQDIAIRTQRWKYIDRQAHEILAKLSWWQNLSGQKLTFPTAELYDLKNDPGETRNVINEHPDVAKDLSKKLAAWHKKVLADQPKETKRTDQVQPYQ